MNDVRVLADSKGSSAASGSPTDGDRELMERVASRLPAAERELVDRLMARVRRAAGALLRNAADADDAAQLSMLEILRSAASFRGEGSLESWADRVTVRTSLRHARKQARSRSLVDPSKDPDHLELAPGEPTRRSEALARHVAAYLDQLPEVRRHALVMRHVLGYSVDEIAVLSGVSRNTVKDRLLAARREFRRLLRREQTVSASQRRSA